MTTREYPNHRKFKSGLQRIIAESVAETLSETDRDIAASWRGALQRRVASRADADTPGLAVDNRLSQIGVRRRQRRGEGQDFHQLREYRAGDSLRQIDWKATSRYRRLISKEYQDERDQQVVFLLDCG